MNPTSQDNRLYAALIEEYRGMLQSDIPGTDDRERFRRLLAGIVQSYLDDLDLAATVGIRIDALETHLARVEARADAKRQLVAETMSRAGMRTLAEPGFFVECLETAAPLLIESEAEIPTRFRVQPAPELDRDKILAALRAGEDVTGARLGDTEATIAVRTK
jgi:hypothetical protein